MQHTIIWERWNRDHIEHLRLEERNDEIIADGMIVGMENNHPFRAHYRIRCDTTWTVRQVSVSVAARDTRHLRLTSDGAGRWASSPRKPVPRLDGCIDVDITLTPFTNTLPIRRLALQPGASAEIAVVYIILPDLHFQLAQQRYTCLSASNEGGRYRYEGLDSGYTTELEVDAAGLVKDYPDIFRRIWPR